MDSDTLAPGTLVAGRYRIVRELGRGGMGAVYVVEHVNTGGLWALKVMLDCTKLQAERASRFRREARASARITSEHVVKVTDADIAPELDGAPFIVMELLDGQDVERLLSSRRLDTREALDILTQVARGLDRAHAAGVVHRDLKPENLFVHRREDGTNIVKVLDFGISKVLRPDGDLASASVTGAADVMGTPLYMAPEQATARHADVGPATDVWAIGLMAVRMLTGEIYWKGDTIAEVFVQIMADTRWPPSSRWPELGPAFDAWFMKSCARDINDRFQSVGEQIGELSAVLTGERPRMSTTVSSPARPRNDSVPPQLVTQIMSASYGPSSSNGPMSWLGVSTAEPVTTPTVPLQPARGFVLAAAGLLLAVLGFVGISLVSRGSGTTIAARSPDAGIAVNTGIAATAGTLTGLGAEPAPAGATPLPPPHVDAGPSTLSSGTGRPLPVAMPAEAPGAYVGQHDWQVGQVGFGQGRVPPRLPGLVGTPASASSVAPVAPPTPSVIAPAKPSATPSDLFDTQK